MNISKWQTSLSLFLFLENSNGIMPQGLQQLHMLTVALNQAHYHTRLLKFIFNLSFVPSWIFFLFKLFFSRMLVHTQTPFCSYFFIPIIQTCANHGHLLHNTIVYHGYVQKKEIGRDSSQYTGNNTLLINFKQSYCPLLFHSIPKTNVYSYDW